LVDVTDDADVGAITEPQLEESLLERARVLVLIDAEPPLPSANRFRGPGVGLEEPDGLDEEIVEVDAAGSILRPLVVLEDSDEEIDRDRRLSLGGRGVRRAFVLARHDPA